MKISRILVACVLLSISGSLYAATVAVHATLSGVGPNVLVNGTASGTRDGNVMVLFGQTVRTEFNDNGTISVWTNDVETHVDFAQLAGDWETSNCIDVSGPVFCALNPPSTGTWDSVAGHPLSFTTTENGTTLTWTVSELTGVPTMPRSGLALIAMGLALLAAYRLRKNGRSV